ncbi:MAG: hypothetical protein V3V08_05190 [Nannocystaceae bacterium]
MKKLAICLLGASLLTGCSDDPEPGADKGEVDRAALEDGLTISLTGDLGAVIVPFSLPIPAGVDTDLEAAMAESVSVVVRNDRSGATANLMSGSLVGSTPTDAGQYTVALNDARDSLRIVFFNTTSAGSSLHSTTPYTGTLSVSTNDYVESLGTTAVAVNVK